jgi:hypothetical protein
MTRARAPIDATRAWEAAETLEAILGPGVDLVHTKRLGWILRASGIHGRDANGPRDGWKEVDSAPDGQLGALLIRHQRRVRGEHV